MLNNKTIAVVIPAYNEEQQIGKVIESMPRTMDQGGDSFTRSKGGGRPREEVGLVYLVGEVLCGAGSGPRGGGLLLLTPKYVLGIVQLLVISYYKPVCLLVCDGSCQPYVSVNW